MNINSVQPFKLSEFGTEYIVITVFILSKANAETQRLFS